MPSSRKSPRDVGGWEERWEAPDPSPGYFPSKLGWKGAKSYYHLYDAQGSFRSYYPYGLNVIWKGESVLLTFKQKSEDSLYIPNFDKSIDNNNNNIGFARISKAKRRKRVTRDMATLKNSMLELAVKFDDNYNTGLIKSFMFGMCE
ncbi:uncharacterized protein TNCV_1862991 [Trichonephila clavipes]|nr:uncharacterized protein TNCV_1862991 [Trichonephila clavipes]